MNGSNRFVLSQLNQWLAQGLTPWLATVIETYGSSPRPEGSLMIYHPEKGIIGSLSGGCIEQELISQLNTAMISSDALPKIIRYGESPEQRSRLALPCGGHLDILLEVIKPQQKEHFLSIENALNSRIGISRQVDLTTGEINTEYSHCDDEIQINHHGLNHTLSHTLKPHDKLLLVGAGEVARCLAEIAKNLDFEVSLCDFREEFLQGWQVEGVQVIKAMPDDLIHEAFNDQHCAIVALAHDPRIDDMAMMQALKTEAFYVGAMGSFVTSTQRRKRLIELELDAKQIEKLHAPIGLDIQSRTPYEIAVSISAHLIEQRSIKQRSRVQN